MKRERLVTVTCVIFLALAAVSTAHAADFKGFYVGGYVGGADALEIALAGKALGAGRDRRDAPIDLAVGIVLQKKIGDPVVKGEPLAVIHARTPADAEKVANRVAASFAIAERASPRPLLLRRVTTSGVERLDM